jgi:uncharacterized protein YijF (DUF1287 family)
MKAVPRRGLVVGLIILIPSLALLAARWRTANEVARLRAIGGNSFVVPASSSAVRSAVDSAVAYARSMLGTPYDPFMGRYGDPFGAVGFVVCIDVPVRAYEAAGVSLPSLLREATHEHPDWFTIGPSNLPGSPFFYRRVRNYHPLFRHHPALTAADTPRVGDWAFFGKTHIALVVNVEQDGRFQVVEASPIKHRVAVSDGDYMAHTWGAPAFFGRLRAAGS